MQPEPDAASAAETVSASDERRGDPRLRVLGYSLALIVFVLDQIVKYWIIAGVRLEERGSIDILPFFNLTWVENRGVSMGLFTAGSDGERWMLVAATALIAGLVGWWLARERNKLDVLALGLVLGGALGNIVDRVRFGYVVDFVHLFWREWHFYVFNVADAAITIGVILLALRVFLAREPANEAESDR